MTEKQIKRLLEDRGKRVADLARDLIQDFPGITEKSADQMLRDLIGGRRWFPVYANWLKEKHEISVSRPAYLLPVRERLRAA